MATLRTAIKNSQKAGETIYLWRGCDEAMHFFSDLHIASSSKCRDEAAEMYHTATLPTVLANTRGVLADLGSA